jgi:hypothetical protein
VKDYLIEEKLYGAIANATFVLIRALLGMIFKNLTKMRIGIKATHICNLGDWFI